VRVQVGGRAQVRVTEQLRHVRELLLCAELERRIKAWRSAWKDCRGSPADVSAA